MTALRDKLKESADEYCKSVARVYRYIENEHRAAAAELARRHSSESEALLTQHQAICVELEARDKESREKLRDSFDSFAAHSLAGCTSDAETAAAAFVALGELVLGGESYPLVIPLLGHKNVLVYTDDELGSHIARKIAIEAIETTAPSGVRLTVFDPLNRRAFAPFSDIPESEMSVIGTTQELRQEIEFLQSEVRRVGNAMGGQDVNIIDYRREHPDAGEFSKMNLVVILDFPSRFTPELAQELILLMNTGPVVGVSFVIVSSYEALGKYNHDAAGAGRPGINLNNYQVNTETFHQPDRDLTWVNHPSCAVNLAIPSDEEIRQRIGNKVASIMCSKVSMVSTLGLPVEQEWCSSSAEGLVAVQIERGNRIEFELAFDDKHPHALLSGTTGSGKTEFMKTMVYNMAQRYSPLEFVLVMLDFKHGLGASVFGGAGPDPTYLPHARILGENSDMAYAVDVLKYLCDECATRAAMFQSVTPTANNVAEYRAQGGVIPRILVIVDEFQELFADSGEIGEEASSYLKRIAAQGRSYGIHLLLSTQALSNVRPSGVNATIVSELKRNAVIRFALQNERSESDVILAPGNATAAELDKYQVDVNDGMGALGSDHVAGTRLVDAAVGQEKKAAWDTRYVNEFFSGNQDAVVKPLVFDGDALCSISDDVKVLNRYFANPVLEGPSEIVLGRDVNVEGRPTTLPLSTNLLIFGGGGEEAFAAAPTSSLFNIGAALGGSAAGAASTQSKNRAIGMLQMVGLSYALQVPGGSAEKERKNGTIHVLNGLTSDVWDKANMGKWVDLIESRTECSVVVTDKQGFAELVADLRKSGDEERSLLLGFDMAPFTSTDSLTLMDLSALLVTGSARGIHAAFWFPTGSACSSLLGNRAIDIPVDATLLLDIAPSAIPSSIKKPGFKSSWSGEKNRCLYFNPTTGDQKRIVPYVPVSQDDLRMLAESEWSRS